MSSELLVFHRDYQLRLPMPLAALYRLAQTANDNRGRHENSFYLWEALVKLAASPGAACYSQDVKRGKPRVPAIDCHFKELGRVSFGHWWGLLRETAEHYGSLPDAASHPLGHLQGQLMAQRTSPGLLNLYRRIKNGLSASRGVDQSCTIFALLDSIVHYRDEVFGNGPGRTDEFCGEMYPLLFAAANEILAEGVFDFLGPPGSRLVFISDVRQAEQQLVAIELSELHGPGRQPTAPLRLHASVAAALAPNRVAVIWPDAAVPLRLDPILIYRGSELKDDVLFLNCQRNKQVEYLSYTTGLKERDELATLALTELLSFDRLSDQGGGYVAEPDFEIIAEIGRGGMGVVYLARQTSLDRLVALKMLPQERAGNEAALSRLRREIRLLAQCDHPNIIKVFDSGVMPDGQLFYAMEYVPGCDLDTVWKTLAGDDTQSPSTTLGDLVFRRAVFSATQQRRSSAAESNAKLRGSRTISQEITIQNRLPPLPAIAMNENVHGLYVRRVVEVVRDAALGLQEAHARNIIHRDIKPSNLMLTPDCTRVVIMDFGLAKETAANASTTAAGFVGTLRYAAPEQLASARVDVGPAADIRGLGVTLWELLTRKRLFDGADERRLAHQILNEDVPKLRKIDPSFDRDLEAIVTLATERNVEDRRLDARAFADCLELYLKGLPLPIRPRGIGEMVLRKLKRNWRTAAAITLLATIFMSVVGYAVIANRRAQAAQLQAETTVGHLANLIGDLADVAQQLRWQEGAEPVQKEILKKADVHSQRLAEITLASPAVSLDRGKLHLRIGNLRNRLFAFTAAQDSFRKAEEAYAVAGPEGLPYLKRAKYGRAWSLLSMGNAPGALELLPEQEPVVVESNEDLAMALVIRGMALTELRRYDEAEETVQRANRLISKIDEPTTTQRMLSILTKRAWGTCLLRSGKLKQSHELLVQADTEVSQLNEAIPFDPEIMMEVAATKNELANLLVQQGDRAKAAELYEFAETIYAQLESVVEGTRFQIGLALTRINLGRLYLEQGRDRQAGHLVKNAFAALNETGQDDQLDTATLRMLVAAALAAGDEAAERGRSEEAKVYYNAGLLHSRPLVLDLEKGQGQSGDGLMAALHHSHLAQVLMNHPLGPQPQDDDAKEHLLKALTLIEKTPAKDRQAYDRNAWAMIHSLLADLYFTHGLLPEAKTHGVNSINEWEALDAAEKSPTHKTYYAAFLLLSRDPDLHSPQRAMEILTPKSGSETEDAEVQLLLAMAQMKATQEVQTLPALPIDRYGGHLKAIEALQRKIEKEDAEAKAALAEAKEWWAENRPGNLLLRQLIEDVERQLTK